MATMRSLPTVVLTLALAAPPTAGAAEVVKSAPFALDEWVELAATDGPVTLHRVRVARQGGVTKSSLMRPGNSEFLQDIQIQLEFSNEASRDWEARLHVTWVDRDGKTIDGYNGSESLDSESRYDQQTVTLSTLRYGLERAAKLEIRIELAPD
jgi:hypothetical protein